MKKKGQVSNQVAQLIPAAMLVVILIVAIVLGAKMLQTVYDNEVSQSGNSNNSAMNISSAGLDAFQTFGDYFDIIVLAIIITVIVGLLLGTFVYFKAR